MFPVKETDMFRNLLERMQLLLSGSWVSVLPCPRETPSPSPTSPCLPSTGADAGVLAHKSLDQGHLAQALKSSFFPRAAPSHSPSVKTRRQSCFFPRTPPLLQGCWCPSGPRQQHIPPCPHRQTQIPLPVGVGCQMVSELHDL